ncbi:hypothetical protein CTI14_68560, partial [Methylobacterium radiotolerans]
MMTGIEVDTTVPESTATNMPTMRPEIAVKTSRPSARSRKRMTAEVGDDDGHRGRYDRAGEHGDEHADDEAGDRG